MKITYITFFLFLSLILFGCGNKSQKSIDCEENITKALECRDNYFFYNAPEYLDSALVYLNEIKGRCKDQDNLVDGHMATIYFLKGDFKKAVKFYENLDASEFSFPEYKTVIVNKIKAKEAKTKGKIELEKEYYSFIIRDMESYLNRHYAQRDSILSLHDMLLLNPEELQIGAVFGELYFYKVKLEGADKATKELDSLQKAINGNDDYFNFLKKSIAGENGYRMSVTFE